MPWPVFPVCPSYGFTKRSDYSVSIVERASGVRTVNRNWYYPLHTFTAVPIETNETEMSRVARFWHAIGGQSGQFRFRDYTDFRSTDLPESAISAVDQPLFETEDANVWQLVKVYVDEEFLFQQQRVIQKPVNGTIVITDGVTHKSEGADYTIDYETGLVTFSGAVSSPSWGGQFHVPVMFESVPEFMISNYRFHQTGFALRELRLELPIFAS
jgi:uncharacterized protein (TIGR02217 family)